jgi:hypothetical protein
MKLEKMGRFSTHRFVRSVRKQKEGKEIQEDKEAKDCGVVTKWGTPLPLFFVSADSKQLRFCGSSLE